MNEIIKVLEVVVRLRRGNLRYRIVYRRTIYNGYSRQTGDELDRAIFNQLNATSSRFIGGNDTQSIENIPRGFINSNIPLINANLDNQIQRDNLSSNGNSFPQQIRTVNLFSRSGTNQNENPLPINIIIDINPENYIFLASTISPFQT